MPTTSQDRSDETRRVFLITWHKCGSQWIRDLLTHHLILHFSGFSNSGTTIKSGKKEPWPEIAEGNVVGPVYSAEYDDWVRHRRPGDRGIVVLRDPRDMIVSWYFSLSYSHVKNDRVRELREDFLRLSPSDRLLAQVANFIIRFPSFRSWIKVGWGVSELEGVYVTSYERFVADTEGELKAIVDFLGWEMPPGVLAEAVRELSFEQRSGRERGAEDPFSHYRKGVPGDWANHFTFSAGYTLDAVCRGFLAESGYDPDPKWFSRLTGGNGQLSEVDGQRLRENIEKEGEIARLREEIRLLRAELERSSQS
ncbi:MAG: sulfotransferase domain-containing protein [Verrucomicrobiales bacterium]